MTPYDIDEFASYVQADVDTATALLLRELVAGLIDGVGSFTDPVPAVVKAVALQAAARAYSNPQGLLSETVGSYSYTRDRAAGSGVFLTADERTALLAVLVPSAGRRVGSIPLVAYGVTDALLNL